jgi:cardiolipin synthase
MARKRANSSYGYTRRNTAKLIPGGAAYFNAIEDILDNASYSVHLQTYIFDPDETGTRVAEALIRAAQRGVLVYVLLDGFASSNLTSGFISNLRNAGVHLEFFQPFLKTNFFYLGRRLHHKVLVADASVCLVAGINISNRYNDIGQNKGWLDWAIYASGEVAMQLNDTCIRVWNRSLRRTECIATRPKPAPLPDTECAIRIIRNDWTYRTTQITRSYRELFERAQSRITIMTSYFWPPARLLRKMAEASARGIKIRVILTAEADVPLSKYSERYLYNWLLRNNIEIYEYQDNVLHGKMAVCDDDIVTAGSYNINTISAYASVELNLEVNNKNMAATANQLLQNIIDHSCRPITRDQFKTQTNWLRLFLYFLAFRINQLIFYIFTFNVKQKKRKRR